MLQKVVYPDSTVKEYLYDATSPGLLIGIVDENNQRFATWGYDAEGLAISSEHGNDKNRFTIDRSAMPSARAVTVTNPLGKATTYKYTAINGIYKIQTVEGHASANCAAANRYYTYYADGMMATKTDWKGVVTRYNYDSSGLEIQRIEAEGTTEERVITTEWHTDLRLPSKITRPENITTFSYDPRGRVLNRTVKPVLP